MLIEDQSLYLLCLVEGGDGHKFELKDAKRGEDLRYQKCNSIVCSSEVLRPLFFLTLQHCLFGTSCIIIKKTCTCINKIWASIQLKSLSQGRLFLTMQADFIEIIVLRR